MMLYISMKFHENIFNDFQVIERTRNDHSQISKGNNFKNILTRAMVLSTLSDDALYFVKFHKNVLNGFQVIERTRFCDGLTDRQPRQKQHVSTASRAI